MTLSQLRRFRAPVAIACVALALRALAAAFFPQSEWADAKQYHVLAQNLLAGHGFSMAETAPYVATMLREPLYPAFLAAVYSLPGPDITLARVLQILLATAACVFAYAIALEIGSEKRVASLAGLLAAVQPTLVLYSSRILSETVASFIVTLGLFSFARAWTSDRKYWFAISGLAMGLVTLIKAVFLLLPLCLAAAYLLCQLRCSHRRKSEQTRECDPSSAPRRATVRAALFLAAMSITVAPWCIRNQDMFGSSAITVRVGAMLYARAETLTQTEDAAATATFRRFRELTARGLNEPAADAHLKQEALARLFHEPLRYLAGNPAQASHVWSCSANSELAGRASDGCTSAKACLVQGLRRVVPVAFTSLLILIALGGVLLLGGAGPQIIPVLAVVYLTVLHSFFALNSCRYSVPVLPAAMILAAQALIFLGQNVRELWLRRARSRG